jgi:hypothetical protein
MENERVPALIAAAVGELRRRRQPLAGDWEQRELFGPSGALDSLQFVEFFLRLERAIALETGKPLRLLGPGLYQGAPPPFSSAAALSAYVIGLLGKS